MKQAKCWLKSLSLHGQGKYVDVPSKPKESPQDYENRTWPGGTVEYGVHTTQHITSNRKAYAMWWILAQIAGWNHESSSESVNTRSNKIDIYPNPGKGVFNIKLNQGGITNLQLFSMVGKKMIDISAASRTENLELEINKPIATRLAGIGQANFSGKIQ